MSKIIEKVYNQKVVFLFLALNPCIDFIFSLTNIVFGYRIDTGINQIIRIMLILYLAIFMKNKRNIIVSFAVGVLLAIGLVVYKVTGRTTSFMADTAFSAKIWCGIVLYFAFYDLYEQNKIDTNMIAKALAISLIIVGVSIIIGHFGLGFNTYIDGRNGSKGFFSSQNAVGITLLILICVNWIFYIGNIINLIAMVIGVISVMLLGTKTSIIGILSCVIAFMVYEFVVNKKIRSYVKKNKLVVSIFALFVVIGISIFVYLFFKEFLKTKIYYDSIYSMIVSNRNLQVKWIREWGDGNFLTILFGYGYSAVRTYLQARKGDFSTIEQDYFGLYYISGIVVLIIYICLTGTVIYYIYTCIRKRCFDREMMGYSVAFSLGVFHAFFAGHVFGEALTLIYFWLISALIKVKATKKVGTVNDEL